MAYREKLAWLALAGMLLGYGAYFVAVIALERPGEPQTMLFVALFGAATLVRVLIEFGGMALVVLRTPQGDRGPPDERDRAITCRSMTVAYYVLLTGMILVGVFKPIDSSGWQIINSALAAIVAAEVTRVGVTLAGYRRGFA